MNNPNFVITGGSGWLGRSVLRRTHAGNMPFNANDLIVAGTSSRLLRLKDLPGTNVLSFSDLNEKMEIEGVVHLAFLTREKVARMSNDAYVRANRDITDRTVDLVKKWKPRWVATVSSGAVFSKNTTQYEKEISINPYGFLKIEEEEKLAEATSKVGANLVVGRLWGATGIDMYPDSKYAISDFIIQAIKTGRIEVRSPNQVFRRYVDSSEFMEILVRLANRGDTKVFNSGGPLVEVRDLAGMISNMVPGCKSVYTNNPNLAPDEYFPIDSAYEQFGVQFRMNLSSLEEQIARTLNAHKAYIGEIIN